MKKYNILREAMILALAVGGLAGCAQNAQMAHADGDCELAALVRGYNDDGYTKKTKIFLNAETVGEGDHFHARATQLERATYYSADNNALLMGNYDGAFGGIGGASGINAGYKNNDKGGVTRFTYQDTAATVANLFDAEHHHNDWSNTTQTVGGYYQTLGTLADAINSKQAQWSHDGDGWWRYNVESVTYSDGEYSDVVLKQFQYFAAPMLLQSPSSYLSFKSIWVMEASNFLSIRIYLTSTDSGKVLEGMATANQALLAEARVFKGVHLDAEAKYYLRGTLNGVDGWDSGYEARVFEYAPHVTIAEQYKLVINLSVGDEFKFGASDWSKGNWGYSALEDGCNGLFAENGGNIKAKHQGEHTFYLKTIEGKVWASVVTESVEVTFTVNFNTYSNGDLYLAGIKGWDRNDNTKMTWTDGNSWTYTVELEIGQTYEFKLVWKKGDSTEQWEKDSGNRSYLATSSETSVTLYWGSY